MRLNKDLNLGPHD